MKRNNLRTRILVSVSIAMVFSLVVSGIITIPLQRARHNKLYMDFQKSLSQAIANSVMLAMMEKKPEGIQSALEDFRQQTGVASVKIIAPDGTISFSTNAKERGLKFQENLLSELEKSGTDGSAIEHREDDKAYMTVLRKINNEPRCQRCHQEKGNIGYLAVESDISWIEKDIITEHIINTVTIILMLALTGIVISIVHIRFVQRNMRKILSAISEVEKGNFSTHIDFQSSDEMGKLSEAFNSMIDRLNSMRKELKLAYQKNLERADKLASVGELAAGMAHEIKNPVAGISSAIQVLLDEMGEDDERRPIFDEILRQIRRVDQAINSLLSYARPRPPTFVSSNLIEVIDKSLKLISQQAISSKVKILRAGDEDLPEVVLDTEQIEQLLVNLMMNAIQAMPRGGSLKVKQTYNAKDKTVTISIADTGEGIAPENLETIFKPFFSTKHRGTGLGLSIIKGIVQNHGGRIFVESKLKGGSVFTVILPLEGKSDSEQEPETQA